MSYSINYTNSFKRDVKNCQKKGLDILLLKNVISQLAEQGTLPRQYSPHKLKGKYNELWECHIRPDWLLIWKQDNTELTLLFTNTGTHSYLFE